MTYSPSTPKLVSSYGNVCLASTRRFQPSAAVGSMPIVALDIKTGKEVWKTPIEDWHNGYGVTAAPLYYDGIVYSGITGGEYGTRGRLTALNANTGTILWRSFTIPTPGE